MKPYGLNKFGMRGCCPGHDDFPRESYGSNLSKRAHRKETKRHRRAERRRIRQELKEELK